ncbi:ATP-binding protein [Actinoallomurus spadix]|uniref:Histidine kinase/HSP90-like ATPase domain-containing protein n=1 Tax=Actinoallomurus spadix TaxID=79912 RepID=A0ABP3HKZ7_9ACTN|nr:ATP-binding protein [Actinoallomurus spadix]MCO5990240.1 ATP-binding protein [Actinoallomurus spadix]
MDRSELAKYGTSQHPQYVRYRHERHLPPVKAAAGTARDFVESRLRAWGRTDQIEDATVIIGELFNNALLHTDSKELVAAIDWNGGRIRLEMWDDSPDRPRIAPVDFEKESGRGMYIIAALCEIWGSRLAASGKCVWVILPE